MKFLPLLLAAFLCVSQTTFAQETIYFNEDFNNDKWELSIGDSNFCVPELLPDNWVVYDSLGLDYHWHWSLQGPRGHYTNPESPFDPNNLFLGNDFWPAESTIENGFIMLESDFHNTDTLGRLKPISLPLSSYIQFGPIDLSGSEFPLIEFSTVISKCCNQDNGRNQLLISTNYSEENADNAIWQEYNIEFSETELFAQRVQLDISSQTGGKSNVYLRWKQMNLSHHFWLIDDITVFEAQKSDVALDDSWFDYNELFNVEDYLSWNPSYLFNGGYTKMPSFTSSNVIQIRAEVRNNGSSPQNVFVDADFYKDENKVTTAKSTTVNVEFLENATVLLPVGFKTTGTGMYQVSATISTSDPNENDSNNSFSYNFEVTDNTYSHVYSENAKSFVNRGPSNFNIGGQNGDIITQRYEILPKAKFAIMNSIQFYFPSYNQPADSNEIDAIKANKFSVIARVYKEDKDNKYFPILPSIIFSDEYTISIDDTGSWVTLPFIDEGNLIVEPGVYYAGLEMYIASSDPRTLNFNIGADLSAPKQMFGGGQVYLTGDGEWHHSFANYAIDLTTQSLNDITDIKSNSHIIFPNPCQNSIQFDNAESIEEIQIFSLDGKLIYTSHNPSKQINTQEFEKGIYLVSTIDKNGNSSSQKLIKQ